MSNKDLLWLLRMASLVGCFFVGWIALLNFPWQYAVRTAIIFEAILIIFLLLAEHDAKGAGGWMSFGFFIGHVILFLSAGFFRILVFLWGLF